EDVDNHPQTNQVKNEIDEENDGGRNRQGQGIAQRNPFQAFGQNHHADHTPGDKYANDETNHPDTLEPSPGGEGFDDNRNRPHNPLHRFDNGLNGVDDVEGRDNNGDKAQNFDA